MLNANHTTAQPRLTGEGMQPEGATTRKTTAATTITIVPLASHP